MKCHVSVAGLAGLACHWLWMTEPAIQGPSASQGAPMGLQSQLRWVALPSREGLLGPA